MLLLPIFLRNIRYQFIISISEQIICSSNIYNELRADENLQIIRSFHGLLDFRGLRKK